MIKKIIVVGTLLLCASCGKEQAFGMKVVGKYIPRIQATCAMVEMVSASKITGQEKSCMCFVAPTTDEDIAAVKEVFDKYGFVVASQMYVVGDKSCDESIKTENLQ